MELVCFWELTGLEKTGVVSATVVGLILFVLGLILAFRAAPWKGKASGGHDKTSLSLPAPLACIVLGVALATGAGWWLWKSFPTESISFSQKPWTLGEVKERLERVSRLRVDLKGEAASFAIDKRFSGACASDVLISICKFYPSKLQCEHNSESGIFGIAMRP